MGRTSMVPLGPWTGLNLRSETTTIEDNELTELVNFNVGVSGFLEKRSGITSPGLLAGNVELLGTFSQGDNDYIIAKSGFDLFYSNTGVTWTKFFDRTVDDTWDVVQYADALYILTTHASGVFKWMGPGQPAPVGDKPTPLETGIAFKDRLFALNSKGANQSRLYFTNPGFGAISPSNFIDVAPGDGDVLVGLAVIFDVLIIFKETSTWGLYVQGDSPSDWVLRNLNPALGCTSRHAIREIEGRIFFVGTDGIYTTDGTAFKEVSDNLDPIFEQRVLTTSTRNIDCLSFWDDLIICKIKAPTGIVYPVYNFRSSAWCIWEWGGGVSPGSFLEVNSSNPPRGLYMGNTDGSGRVYKYGDGSANDVGNEFEARFATKDFNFDQPGRMKRITWLGLILNNPASAGFASHYVDGQLLEEHTLEPRSHGVHKIKGPGYFRRWKLRYRTTSVGYVYPSEAALIPKAKVINNRS